MPHPAADRGSATISITIGAAVMILLLAALIGGIAQQGAHEPAREPDPRCLWPVRCGAEEVRTRSPGCEAGRNLSSRIPEPGR